MARHKSIERPPIGQTVGIVLDGQRYEATYNVDGPILAIDSPLLGVRRVPLGNGTPDAVAKLALAELVYSIRRR
jgi:hypothetical protein